MTDLEPITGWGGDVRPQGTGVMGEEPSGTTGATHWRGVNSPMKWGTHQRGVLWKQAQVSARQTHVRLTHRHLPVKEEAWVVTAMTAMTRRVRS